MVFLVAAAILTASVVYDVKNRREMAAELEDWVEVKSRKYRRREEGETVSSTEKIWNFGIFSLLIM